MGAQIIENILLNKKLKGNDHYHNMDKNDLRNFLEIMEKKEFFQDQKRKNLNEYKSIKYARRAIYAKRQIENSKSLTQMTLLH